MNMEFALTDGEVAVETCKATIASALMREQHNCRATKKEMAESLGVSLHILNRIYNGDYDVPLSLVGKIRDVTGIRFTLRFE